MRSRKFRHILQRPDEEPAMVEFNEHTQGAAGTGQAWKAFPVTRSRCARRSMRTVAHGPQTAHTAVRNARPVGGAESPPAPATLPWVLHPWTADPPGSSGETR